MYKDGLAVNTVIFCILNTEDKNSLNSYSVLLINKEELLEIETS